MLDGDHARLVAVALPVCAEYGLALAGGYAIKAHHLVDRPSEDIDFATAATASMDEILAALASSYRAAGCNVQVLDVDLRKGHLLVSFAEGGTYRVDVLKEPLNHPLTMTEHGPEVERGWFRRRVAGLDVPFLFSSPEDPDGEFDHVDEADAARDLQAYRDELAAARAAAAGHDLDETFYHQHREVTMSVRWVYLHMIEEYARHNGHSDLLRERTDGRTGR